MQSLKVQVQSLDVVPEALRGLYDPVDGGYKLRLDDPEQVTRALKVEREQRKEAERTVRSVKEEADLRASEQAAEQRRIQADRDRAVALLAAMKQRALDTQMTAAAKAAGLHDAAIPDFVRAAKEKFGLSDSGELVGINGHTGTLIDFAESARELSPHWFPATGSGGGASSSASSTPTHNTMTRAKFDQLRPRQQRAVLLGGTKLID
jgi:hypothetical protein